MRVLIQRYFADLRFGSPFTWHLILIFRRNNYPHRLFIIVQWYLMKRSWLLLVTFFISCHRKGARAAQDSRLVLIKLLLIGGHWLRGDVRPMMQRPKGEGINVIARFLINTRSLFFIFVRWYLWAFSFNYRSVVQLNSFFWNGWRRWWRQLKCACLLYSILGEIIGWDRRFLFEFNI